MLKKSLAVLLASAMMATALAGCAAPAAAPAEAPAAEEAAPAEEAAEAEETEGAEEAAPASDYAGTIRWLNYKPEVADQMNDLAKAYTEETGIKVQIDTAASNTYEQTLTARMDSSDAPAIFVVDGVNMLNTWKDYCRDLSDTDLYSWPIR